MRSLFSYKAVPMIACASVGVVAGLTVGLALYEPSATGETTAQRKVAESREDALKRSAQWLKERPVDESRIAASGTRANVRAEIGSGLLETARMPDMSEIIVAEPVLDKAQLRQISKIDYTSTGSLTIIKPARSTGYRPGLERFHSRLDALDAKRRSRPVTVLHIGGSHVAADGFSRGIREDMQKRYGDAGRGMVQPAGIADAGAADQMDMKITGKWNKRHAVKDRRGRFGISGTSVSSSSTDASMRLTKKNGPFDWASVTIATGPDQGKVRLRVGMREKVYSARAQRPGSHTFRLDVSGTSLIVEPAGEGETTVLNWATGKVRPGIRYVNFGLDGASADTLHRFSAKLMEKDIRRLAPDLIIIGYGTKEGFNDTLGLSGYKVRLAKAISRLKDWAPEADFVFVGAASGLRKGSKGSCDGWTIPPKLAPLRKTIRELSIEHDGVYWDWSSAMGGPCAINAWAKNGLADENRTHLTATGYRRSARLFSKWLMQKSLDAVAANTN